MSPEGQEALDYILSIPVFTPENVAIAIGVAIAYQLIKGYRRHRRKRAVEKQLEKRFFDLGLLQEEALRPADLGPHETFHQPTPVAPNEDHVVH